MLDSANDLTSYQFHIFTPGFPNDVRLALLELVSGTRHGMKFHVIDPVRFADVPKNRGSWTEIVYYRLLASEMLPDLDRAIYSDVDVFVAKDLASVFNTDLLNSEWAGVAAERNIPETVMHRYFPENGNEIIFFSGFMVMNLKLMRENNAVFRYFEGIRLFGDRLKFFDLDLLNICTPEIVGLPFDYCVLESVYETEDVTQAKDWAFLKTLYTASDLEAARNQPAIIHFAGERGKPWQRRDVPIYFFEVEKRIPPRLRRKTIRDMRKRWLSGKGRRRLVSRTPSVFI